MTKIFSSRWLWWMITALLCLFVCIVYYAIYQVHTSSAYWKNQFHTIKQYRSVRFVKAKIQLNEKMKQWLSKEEVRNKKYYRAVIKGYGSYGQLLQGSGIIQLNIKHYYLCETDFTIQGSVLKTSDGIFCSNWQLIKITPEEYIFYLYNTHNKEI